MFRNPETEHVSASTDKSGSSDDADAVYDNETERQWSEADSIQGVDPGLLDEEARSRQSGVPTEQTAAFSPWLIPFAAILTGPLVAALLALFADGDPPSGRQATALVSTGLAGWVVNVGMASTEARVLAENVESMIRLGILATAGMALWAMYTFWMRGARALERDGLVRSAVILALLSGVFWFGRATDPGWWAWMGR